MQTKLFFTLIDENLKGQMHLCPPHMRFFEKFRVSGSEDSVCVQESMRKVFGTNAKWPEQIFPWRSQIFWEIVIFPIFLKSSSTRLMQMQHIFITNLYPKLFFSNKVKTQHIMTKFMILHTSGTYIPKFQKFPNFQTFTAHPKNAIFSVNMLIWNTWSTFSLKNQSFKWKCLQS